MNSYNSLNIVSVIQKNIALRTKIKNRINRHRKQCGLEKLKPRVEDSPIRRTFDLMSKFSRPMIVFDYNPYKPFQKCFVISECKYIDDENTPDWIIQYGNDKKVLINKCVYINTKELKEINIANTIKKVKTIKPLARKLRRFFKLFGSVKRHSSEILNKYEELKSKYECSRSVYGYTDFNEEQNKLMILYYEERTYDCCMHKLNSMRQRKPKVLLD